MDEPRGLLKRLWWTGVSSVSGQHAVADALARDGCFPADLVVAVGKAACSMFLGAQDCISPETRSIIVSKYRHVDTACRQLAGAEIVEAGHPVPDRNSLVAGDRILRAISDAGRGDRLLLLVSGGASALAEVLRPGLDLAGLQAITGELLSAGKSIEEINEIRGRLSLIKGGGLLHRFQGKEARVYALSDVRGDRLAIIGAGIGDPRLASARVKASVVASNAGARKAVADEALRLGYPIRLNEESLYEDISSLAPDLSGWLMHGLPGVYLWGGEPTIELPPKPGTGGRNQSLALSIATCIRFKLGIWVLVAGTDGTDGPTDHAGAFVDGRTVDDIDDAEKALRDADAGRFLGRRGCLFDSGPTSTNVMDLVVAIVAERPGKMM